MTQQSAIKRAATGLPVASLLEIHDLVILALDATEGSQPQHWQMPRARGNLRSALRSLGWILPTEAVQ
jgi:hypothetical protein